MYHECRPPVLQLVSPRDGIPEMKLIYDLLSKTLHVTLYFPIAARAACLSSASARCLVSCIYSRVSSRTWWTLLMTSTQARYEALRCRTSRSTVTMKIPNRVSGLLLIPPFHWNHVAAGRQETRAVICAVLLEHSRRNATHQVLNSFTRYYFKQGAIYIIQKFGNFLSKHTLFARTYSSTYWIAVWDITIRDPFISFRATRESSVIIVDSSKRRGSAQLGCPVFNKRQRQSSCSS
jgi:hypothetical protein